VQDPPEQEDKSSPSLSMELKFELDTRLTVSCVVAVASAYSLVTVLIAINSVLFAFGNAVILLLILFVLFGWREPLGDQGLPIRLGQAQARGGLGQARGGQVTRVPDKPRAY